MPKVIDVSRLSNDALRDLVDPRRRRLASPSLILAAMREAEIRTSGGLDFDRTFRVLETAASERGVVGYREIAEASGAPWATVYARIEGHLARLAGYSEARGWPKPSAIVVRENVATAGTRPEPLNGLLEAARAAGFAAADDSRFLREQQKKLADWASGQEGAPPTLPEAPPASAPRPRSP